MSQTQDSVNGSNARKLNAAERELFSTLTRHLAEGHSVEEISREMDYPLSFLEKLLLRPEFDSFFREKNQAAHRLWLTARETDEADEIVKHLARSNAVRNYKALQSLVDGDELKAEVKANYLERLIRMSGTIGDEIEVEVVKLSNNHIAAIRQAAKDID